VLLWPSAYFLVTNRPVFAERELVPLDAFFPADDFFLLAIWPPPDLILCLVELDHLKVATPQDPFAIVERGWQGGARKRPKRRDDLTRRIGSAMRNRLDIRNLPQPSPRHPIRVPGVRVSPPASRHSGFAG
jgi:hypothetical protein